MFMYMYMYNKNQFEINHSFIYLLVPSSVTSVETCSQAEGARGTSETLAMMMISFSSRRLIGAQWMYIHDVCILSQGIRSGMLWILLFITPGS